MRKAAVTAATKKAEPYAEETGAALSPIVHIEDVDPERLRGERTRGGSGGGATGDFRSAPLAVEQDTAVQIPSPTPQNPSLPSGGFRCFGVVCNGPWWLWKLEIAASTVRASRCLAV